MNAHAAGQRVGWVLAAAVLVAGASSGLLAQGARSYASDTSPADVSVANVAPDLGGQVLGVETNAMPQAQLSQSSVTPASSQPLVHVWPRIPIDGVAASAPAPAPAATVTPKVTTPAPAPRPATVTPKPAPVWWSVYHGTNHVWMPTLGINKPVYGFACSRGTDPANDVYRWGCAGSNNVYLLGHAWGVFKALHDAYFNGKLKVGMPVIYADSRGRVHLYRVTKWQVVSPTNISWSSSLRVPSMTLQTCIGANSQYRLNVRLVQVSA